MQTRKRPSPSTDSDFEPNSKSQPTKAARTSRASTRKAKTAEELLSEPKNTIFDLKTDLFAMIRTPDARKAIEELRPDLVDFHKRLTNEPGLARRCIANFQRDGRYGFYDPEWQSQAREAFERHRDGEFDEYLMWKAYQDWPELEEIHKAKAAEEAEAAKIDREKEDELAGEEQRGFTADTEALVQSTSAVGRWKIVDGQIVVEEGVASERAEVQEPAGDETQYQDQEQDKGQGDTGSWGEPENLSETELEKHFGLEQAGGEEQLEVEELATEQEQTGLEDKSAIPEQVHLPQPTEEIEDQELHEPQPHADLSSTETSTSDRVPTTPPRERSPDVQCITDSGGRTSRVMQSIMEDVPKPPVNNVESNKLTEIKPALAS